MSHLTCPINLQYRESYKLWNSMSDKYHAAKENDKLKNFKYDCQMTSAHKEMLLLRWLKENEVNFDEYDNVRMTFKQMADEQVIYEYFSKIKV